MAAEPSTASALPFDLVESVVAILPIADLLSAAAVSTSWRSAAIASPRRRRPPSLLLHTHTLRSHLGSATTATAVLEPDSPSGLRLPPLPSPPFRLRSSTSDALLYTLSSSHLSYSSDPLHLRWTHLPSPGIWRVNPVVALVGSHLVAAAGVSEFEDDPLTVEVFDGHWRPASSMPHAFKNSACASYLSGAVAGRRLHIAERRTARTSSFDPVADTWTEVVDLLAGVHPRPFAVAIAATAATSGGCLIVAGVMGRAEEVTGVRLWEARAGESPVAVAEMPADMVARFARGKRGESSAGVWAVEVRTAEVGGCVYVYNPSDMAEAFYFRAGAAGGEEWGVVDTGVEGGCSPSKAVVVTCSALGMEDLRAALCGGAPADTDAGE